MPTDERESMPSCRQVVPLQTHSLAKQDRVTKIMFCLQAYDRSFDAVSARHIEPLYELSEAVFSSQSHVCEQCLCCLTFSCFLKHIVAKSVTAKCNLHSHWFFLRQTALCRARTCCQDVKFIRGCMEDLGQPSWATHESYRMGHISMLTFLNANVVL